MTLIACARCVGAGAVDQLIADICAAPAGDSVVIDLSGSHALDGGGLCAVIAAGRRHPGLLGVVVSERVGRSLAEWRLDDEIEVFSSVDDAVAVLSERVS